MSIKNIKKDIKNRLEYYSFRTILLIGKLFPFKWNRFFLGKLFRYFGYILNIRRSLIETQLKYVFKNKTDKEIKKIVLDVYENLGKLTSEMYFANYKNLIKDIEVEGFEYLEKTYNEQKGVILASGHIGNWEVAGQYIGSKGLKITAVAKKMRNNYFNYYTEKLRLNQNVELIYVQKVMSKIISTLRNGKILALLIDQDAKKNGAILPFLGKEASLFLGPARFALKFNSPIIFGISIRKPNNKIKLIFEPPIYPEDFSSYENPELEITKILNKKLEDYIYQYPEQWFWVHRKWRYADKLMKGN